MIKIRGKEFDYPAYDIDAMERNAKHEAALRASLGELSTLEGLSDLGQLKAMYAACATYFDATLGEGSLSTILDGKRDVLDAMAAVYDFRDAVAEAMQSRAGEVAMRAKLPEKYSLAGIRK